MLNNNAIYAVLYDTVCYEPAGAIPASLPALCLIILSWIQ